MERSNWAINAVVEVTSVQPTSENRTVWQLGGSRRPAAGGGAPLIGVAVSPRVVAVLGMAEAASACTGSAPTSTTMSA